MYCLFSLEAYSTFVGDTNLGWLLQTIWPFFLSFHSSFPSFFTGNIAIKLITSHLARTFDSFCVLKFTFPFSHSCSCILLFVLWPWNKEVGSLGRKGRWHHFPVHIQHVGYKVKGTKPKSGFNSCQDACLVLLHCQKFIANRHTKCK